VIIIPEQTGAHTFPDGNAKLGCLATAYALGTEAV